MTTILMLLLPVLAPQDPEARTQELILQLKDDASNVRVRAVRELTKLGAKSAASEIRALLKDADWEARYFSVIALTQFEDRESLASIKPLLADPEPTVIVAAAQAIALLSVGDAAFDEMTGLLKHANADVRQAVLAQLGSARHQKSAKQIVEMFKDPERKVVLEAIRASGLVGAAEAVEGLLAFALTDDAEFRATAIEALKGAGNEKNVKALQETMQSRKNVPELWEVAAYWGDKKAIPWFSQQPDQRPLWILNRFASADAVQKLRARRLDRRDLKAPVLTSLFDRIARTTGLAVEWDPALPAEKKGSRLSGPVVDGLNRSPSCEQVLNAAGLSWILDGSKIRIVTREAELAHWKAWFEALKDE